MLWQKDGRDIISLANVSNVSIEELDQAMIFNGKPVDDITETEIDGLVKDHVMERQHLEFKATVNYQDDTDRLELLRDIVSLANAGGGYLIIGIRDDGHGRAQKYEPILVGDTARIGQSIRSLCLDHISDRIDGLEIRSRTVGPNSLLLIRIPISDRIPHMVTFQNRTEFYTRYGDGKREMTLSEIREALSHDSIAHRLSHVEALLSELGETRKDEQQRSELAARLETGVVPQFTAIQSGETLADATFRRFASEVGNQPFFRVAVTPCNPGPNLMDVDRKEIRTLLDEPPGSRDSGWNMELGTARIERFSEGIRRGLKNLEYLELFSNGHMEFWSPLGQHFCWRQSQEEFRIQPRLYSYPVTEYPCTFFRLYRALVNAAQLPGDFLVGISYLNLKGYVLAPYAPQAYGGISVPFEQEHLVVPQMRVTNAFLPDSVAYDLIRVVYAGFGLGADAIPFFTQDEGFDFPSR